MTPPSLSRPTLERAWQAALDALDPRSLIRRSLRSIGPPHDTCLIATGKAAPKMAEGACDVIGPDARGIVVTTDRTEVRPLPTGIRVLRGAHPVPDPRSVHAADEALDLARSAQGPLMLVLVSGGTSSLLCAPGGLSLEQKRHVTDSLLRGGSSIQECNTVRRHLSAIKGGRLAAAFPRHVHCLIVSDVVHGEPHDVGSGPACVDPTTIDDATRIVRKALDAPLASLCEAAFSESVKPCDPTAKRMTVSVLARPVDLATTFADHLRSIGMSIEVDSVDDTTAESLSATLVERARALRPGQGWVAACEPTLTVPRGAGHGGRAGWVALKTWLHLPDDVTLWAAASDGVDGNSSCAGACVRGSDRSRLDPPEVESRLCARDDAFVHRSLGTALQGGPTGTNLTDVYAVLRDG